MPPFRPGRPRRLPASLTGSAPLSLPQATTLPASQITVSGASLNGSANPMGLTCSTWFAWGVTPAYGSTTTPVAIGAGSLPVTLTTALAGLTVGQTYHYAMVARTSAGTVFGFDAQFVAQAQPVVSVATDPTVPYGQPAVSTPHWACPFQMTSQGVKVVEQDSAAEVFACVQTIVNTPEGSIPEIPSFGVPELTFSQAPVNPVALVSAVRRLEPRANEQAVGQAIDDTGGQWQVTLTTQTTGASEAS